MSTRANDLLPATLAHLAQIEYKDMTPDEEVVISAYHELARLERECVQTRAAVQKQLDQPSEAFAVSSMEAYLAAATVHGELARVLYFNADSDYAKEVGPLTATAEGLRQQLLRALRYSGPEVILRRRIELATAVGLLD